MSHLPRLIQAINSAGDCPEVHATCRREMAVIDALPAEECDQFFIAVQDRLAYFAKDTEWP